MHLHYFHQLNAARGRARGPAVQGMAARCATAGYCSLALDEKAERLERADRNCLERENATSRERQRVDGCFGLVNRVGVHEKDHAGLIVAEPELLDLAVKVELERTRDFLRHDLLPLFVCF